jgi:hypothetical protein
MAGPALGYEGQRLTLHGGVFAEMLTIFKSLSKYMMSSGMRVFFIQKLRGASFGKMNIIPSSAGMLSLNINPRACFSWVSAISTVKRLPPNSTPGSPEAQATQEININTHNKKRIRLIRLLVQPNDSKHRMAVWIFMLAEQMSGIAQ